MATKGADRIWRRVLMVALALVCIVATAYCLELAAEWLVLGKTTTDTARSINDARNSLIQLLGGAALLGGLVYTARTFALSRATNLDERFTRAIDQLGHESSGVRVGGIYSLEFITREDARYWDIVDQVLVAHAKEFGRKTAPITPDVQAAIRVLAKRGQRSLNKWRPLDFSGARLVGCEWSGDFGRALFKEATLNDSNFIDAILPGCQFPDASLEKVKFYGADLAKCNFRMAVLRGAEFNGANVRGADFKDADLADAKGLTESQLQTASVRPKGTVGGK